MTRFIGDVEYILSPSLRPMRYAACIGATNAEFERLQNLVTWGNAETGYIRGRDQVNPHIYILPRIELGRAIREEHYRVGVSRIMQVGIGFDVPAPEDLIGSAVFEGGNTVYASRISERNANTVDTIMELGQVADTESTARARRELEDLYNASVAATAGDDSVVFTPHENSGIVNSDVLGALRPSDALMETLPAAARGYATVTIFTTARGSVSFFRVTDDGAVEFHRIRAGGIGQYGWTGQQLVDRARGAHRSWLRSRIGSNVDPRSEAAARAQAEHRRRAAEKFATFRSKQAVQDELIPTLPFVPHGLASSRRWGIEIESGGARGISAPPNGWDRKTDGSLRSAWEGYREVQTFEPYDEEVSELISWYACVNSERHMPNEEYYDEARSEYAWRVSSNYMPVEDCTECGNRTRTVRREPQTITHSRQSDDCAEFVSPILVSMHSNGLESLLSQIALQPQNDTAGVHVHVESNDLTDKQIATLVYGYDLIEPFIEKSYRRNVRRFCERTSVSDALAAARMSKDGDATKYNVRDRTRYLTVNTQALRAHGTIEFRAMGPVYDYEYLTRWAMFCREMVNIVAAGATQKDFGRIRKWEDLLALFARYGKEYVRAAVYEMTGETGKAAALSKEGRAITTEALNEDFNEVFAAFTRSIDDASEAIGRLVAVNHDLVAA